MIRDVAENASSLLPKWAVVALAIAIACYAGWLGWGMSNRIVSVQVGPVILKLTR